MIMGSSFLAFREGRAEFGAIVHGLAALGFEVCGIVEGHYGALDNALAQVDLVLVEEDHRLDGRFFGDAQLKRYSARYKRSRSAWLSRMSRGVPRPNGAKSIR